MIWTIYYISLYYAIKKYINLIDYFTTRIFNQVNCKLVNHQINFILDEWFTRSNYEWNDSDHQHGKTHPVYPISPNLFAHYALWEDMTSDALIMGVLVILSWGLFLDGFGSETMWNWSLATRGFPCEILLGMSHSWSKSWGWSIRVYLGIPQGLWGPHYIWVGFTANMGSARGHLSKALLIMSSLLNFPILEAMPNF